MLLPTSISATNYKRPILAVLIGYSVVMMLLTSCIPIWNQNNAASITQPQSQRSTTTPIEINITTHLGDQQTFESGDELSFLVSIDQSAFILLLYQDASGQLWQLLPNDYQARNKFNAGEFLPIPGKEVPYRFVVGAPYGQETLWAFASNLPLPELPSRLAQNGMLMINTDMAKVQQTLASHSANKKTHFGRAKIAISTQK